MNRRQVLGALLAALTPSSLVAANPSVSTLIGTGSRGYSDHEVNNPYGLVIGPDRAVLISGQPSPASRPATGHLAQDGDRPDRRAR